MQRRPWVATKAQRPPSRSHTARFTRAGIWRDRFRAPWLGRGFAAAASFLRATSSSRSVSARSKIAPGSPSGTSRRRSSWARRNFSCVAAPTVNWTVALGRERGDHRPMRRTLWRRHGDRGGEGALGVGSSNRRRAHASLGFHGRLRGRGKLAHGCRHVGLRSQTRNQRLDLPLASSPSKCHELIEVIGPQVRSEQPRRAQVQGGVGQQVEDGGKAETQASGFDTVVGSVLGEPERPVQ